MTKRLSRGALPLIFASVLMLVYSVLFPERAAQSAFSAMLLCAKSVVPSLFFFTVAVKLFVYAGGTRLFCSRIFFPLRALLHLSPAGLCAALLGLVSGFPMGAVTLASLLRAGQVDRAEAQSILPFAVAASPAFLIGAVGSSLFRSRSYGTALFLSQLLSALLMLLLTRGERARGKDILLEKNEQAVSVFRACVASVRETGTALLSVTAFIVFFGIFSSALASLLPSCIGTALAGIFEISTGFSRLSEYGEGMLSFALGGAMVGFAGVSVMLQSFDVLASEELSPAGYIIGKTEQGALCALISTLFFIFGSGKASKILIYLFGESARRTENLFLAVLIFAFFAGVCALTLVCFKKISSFFQKNDKIFKKLWKNKSK